MYRDLRIHWYHYIHHFFLQNPFHTKVKSNQCHSALRRNKYQFWMRRGFVSRSSLTSKQFQGDNGASIFSNLRFSLAFLLFRVQKSARQNTMTSKFLDSTYSIQIWKFNLHFLYDPPFVVEMTTKMNWFPDFRKVFFFKIFLKGSTSIPNPIVVLILWSRNKSNLIHPYFLAYICSFALEISKSPKLLKINTDFCIRIFWFLVCFKEFSNWVFNFFQASIWKPP